MLPAVSFAENSTTTPTPREGDADVNWKPDRYGGLRALLWRRSLDDEVREELEHHIAERVASNIARGMSEQAARQEALQRFGDVERFARETVEIDESVLRETRRMQVVDTLWRELKQSLRGLMRAPLFAIVAVITLALGIGASTAVYTLLKAVVLDPLPYPSADRLVLIDHEVPGLGPGKAWGLSSASYFHFRERMRTADQVAAFWVNSANLRAEGEAIRGTGVWVSANLLDLLGARPALGRLLTESDDHSNAPRVAVLSHDYWQSEFGGSRDVVGKVIEVNGNPTEIVGVVERGFSLPDQNADVLVARRLDAAGPHVNWHHMAGIVRMRPGVTLDAVQAELTQLTLDLPDRFPAVYDQAFMSELKFSTRARDLRESIVGELARVLWILLGSVAVVLMIASVNVANLFLVRAESRRNEQAVRSALGAERSHLFVQSLSESLLISAAAGTLGIVLAYAGLKLLIAIAPSSLPRLDEVHLTTGHMLFGFSLALAAGLAFALFPVLRRHIDYGPLREGGRGLTASRVQLRVRSTLVTAQIALAVVLLASAGLMLRSFQAMRSVELGVNPDNVLTLTVSLPGRSYDTQEKAANFWRRMTEQVEALPGVQHMGTTGRLPVTGIGCAIMIVNPPAVATDRLGCIPNMVVTPGFFDAAGIRISGRTPTWSDVDAGTGAVVISRALAKLLWPGEDAIGRGLKVPQGGNSPVYYTIVGIADDIRGEGARKPPTEVVYYPVREIEGAPLWGPMTGMAVMIRTSTSNPLDVAPAVRRVISSLDASAAIGDVASYRDVIDRTMVQTTFTTVLLGIAGGMALVLSIVGLYGVVAYTVSRRRTEIGIRMAMGARASQVRSMVVLQSMQLGALGVGIGLVAAALTTQMLRSLLFDVKPTDGVTLSAVAFSLLLVAALASLIPAWRAAAVDPTETLRS